MLRPQSRSNRGRSRYLQSVPGTDPGGGDPGGGGGGGNTGGEFSHTGDLGEVVSIAMPAFPGAVGAVTYEVYQEYGTAGTHPDHLNLGPSDTWDHMMARGDERIPWRIRATDSVGNTEVTVLTLGVTESVAALSITDTVIVEDLNLKFVEQSIGTSYDGTVTANLTHPPGAVKCHLGFALNYTDNPDVGLVASSVVTSPRWHVQELWAVWLDTNDTIIAVRSAIVDVRPELPAESTPSTAKEPLYLFWLPGNRLMMTFMSNGRKTPQGPNQSSDVEWIGDSGPEFGVNQIDGLSWTINGVAANVHARWITPWGRRRSYAGVQGKNAQWSRVILDIPAGQVSASSWAVAASGGGKGVASTSLSNVSNARRRVESPAISIPHPGWRPNDRKLVMVHAQYEIEQGDSCDFTGQSWWLVPAGAANESSPTASGTLQERLNDGSNGEDSSREDGVGINRTRARIFYADITSVTTAGYYDFRTEAGQKTVYIHESLTSKQTADLQMKAWFHQAAAVEHDAPYTNQYRHIGFHTGQGVGGTVVQNTRDNYSGHLGNGFHDEWIEGFTDNETPWVWGGIEDAADWDTYSKYFMSMGTALEAIIVDPDVASGISGRTIMNPWSGTKYPDYLWHIHWQCEAAIRQQITTQAKVDALVDPTGTLAEMYGAVTYGRETTSHPNGVLPDTGGANWEWAGYHVSVDDAIFVADGMYSAGMAFAACGHDDFGDRYKDAAMLAYNWVTHISNDSLRPDPTSNNRNMSMARAAAFEAKVTYDLGSTALVRDSCADYSGNDTWEGRLLSNPIVSDATQAYGNDSGNWIGSGARYGNMDQDFFLTEAAFWFCMLTDSQNPSIQSWLQARMTQSGDDQVDAVNPYGVTNDNDSTFWGYTTRRNFWVFAGGPSTGLRTISLSRAHYIDGGATADYGDAATVHRDFVLGRNPQNFCFQLGGGFRSALQALSLEHRQGNGFQRQGIVLYGLNTGALGRYNGDTDMFPVGQTGGSQWPDLLKFFDNGDGDVPRSEWTMHQGYIMDGIFIWLAFQDQS